MDRRALKYHDKLTDYPPQECDGPHCVHCSSEPDLCRQLVGMFGEDACIEEEDREFDHCNSRGIEVLEDVKDLVPLFRCVRPSHCLMLAKVKVGRCPVISYSVSEFANNSARPTYEIQDRQHPSQWQRNHDSIVIVPKPSI